MRIGLWIFVFYVGFCLLALLAIALSAAGWIAPDPLSAIPAMLLGLPWSYLLFRLVETQSLAANAALLALPLALNAAILWLIVRAFRRRPRR